MRRLVVGAVIFLGVGASIASSPGGGGGDIQGSSGGQSVTLDAPGQSETASATATLNANAPLATGSGEVGVTVDMDASAIGSLTIGLESDTTGEATSTDVVDPSAQPSTRVAIPAFEGCSGETSCSERFVLTFDRFDEEGDGTLSFTWTLDGLASTTAEEPDQASGTLEFSIE